MSRLLVTVAVDNASPGRAIGVKEAIAMDLEKYGDVRVLRVEVQEPEQLSMDRNCGGRRSSNDNQRKYGR